MFLKKFQIYKSIETFESIISLEKQRLKILKSFHVKPSDSGIKLVQNILEKNKKNIDIIENEKLKLNKNFKKVKNIFSCLWQIIFLSN